MNEPITDDKDLRLIDLNEIKVHTLTALFIEEMCEWHRADASFTVSLDQAVAFVHDWSKHQQMDNKFKWRLWIEHAHSEPYKVRMTSSLGKCESEDDNLRNALMRTAILAARTSKKAAKAAKEKIK